MIVALEGMDGSGKSTVAEKIAPNIGFAHYKQKMIDKYGMDENFEILHELNHGEFKESGTNTSTIIIRIDKWEKYCSEANESTTISG